MIRGGVTPCSLPHFRFMSCNHPLHAFPTGRLTVNNKDEYLIVSGSLKMLSFSEAQKITNDTLKDCRTVSINGRQFLTDPLEVPCGKCVGCRMAHAKEWSVRCSLEKEDYADDECLFLTLTYDNRHLPNGLCRSDLQKFWKRLRKAGYKFRYFACGEYGSTTHRPHYHAIVFGLKVPDLRFYSLSDTKSTLYVSRIIQDIWGLGLVSIGYADSSSIAYVAGYVEKKQNDPFWDSYPVKPFVVMSRKPAIGSRYLSDGSEAIISSNKVYGSFGRSHSAPVPRHFIRKLGELDPFWLAGRSAASKEKAEKARDLDHAVYGTTDDARIADIKDSMALLRLAEIERS